MWNSRDIEVAFSIVFAAFALGCCTTGIFIGWLLWG